MKPSLRSSRPDALSKLNVRERALFARFPADFFYDVENGGRPRDAWRFTVPLERRMGGQTHKGTTTELGELWAFMPRRVAPAKNRPRSLLREHFGRHVAEEFLPRDVFVFGYAMQSCLLAISLAPHNHGEALYWEWYWQYPWYKDFFHQRIKAAKKAFDARRRDLSNRELPSDHTLGDALNSATLVPIAPAFGAFVDSLEPSRDDD